MNQYVTTYLPYETRQSRPVASPFALAKTYAAKFAETHDPQFAFAAIKHAANLMLSKPCVALSHGTVEVTVNTATATTFTSLRERVTALIPGVTFAEVDAAHTVGVNVFTGSLFVPKAGDRATLTTQRRKLKVSLPLAPLSNQTFFDMIEVLLTWHESAVIEQAFESWFGMDMAQVIQAVRERDPRTNTVLQNLIELKEIGYSHDVHARFIFAVQTRRDGELYDEVAEQLTELFEE